MDGNREKYEGEQVSDDLGAYKGEWNLSVQNVFENYAYWYSERHINVCLLSKTASRKWNNLWAEWLNLRMWQKICWLAEMPSWDYWSYSPKYSNFISWPFSILLSLLLQRWEGKASKRKAVGNRPCRIHSRRNCLVFHKGIKIKGHFFEREWEQ